MRGSAVLRSFGPRSRESSRLLNALTGAFRKHLDDVHPTTAEPPQSTPSRKSDSSVLSRPPAVHSSTVAADRHLASILTNPLIDNAGGASASKRLQTALKTPGADPITVFEELHVKQRLNLLHATQCLDHYLATLQGLPEDVRLEAMRQKSPGSRFLSWLYLDATHFEADLSRQLYFHRNLVYLLLVEGHEKLLWEHLRLGRILCQDPKYPTDTPAGPEQPQKSSPWLVSLVSDMIIAKLHHPPRGLNRDKTLDDALQVCLDAFSLRSSNAIPRIPMLMPCWKVVSFLDRGTLKEAHRLRETFSVSSRTYRIWLDLVMREAESNGSFYWQLVYLRASLNHPEYRDPASSLKLLDRLCDPRSDTSGRIAKFNKMTDTKFRHRWFLYFVDCALYLAEAGQAADATRYFSTIESYYPERKQQLQYIRRGQGDNVEQSNVRDPDETVMGGILQPGIT